MCICRIIFLTGASNKHNDSFPFFLSLFFCALHRFRRARGGDLACRHSVSFWAAAGGAYWPLAIRCSIGSGARRPLPALCPSSSSLAYPSLSTSLSFPFPFWGAGGWHDGCVHRCPTLGAPVGFSPLASMNPPPFWARGGAHWPPCALALPVLPILTLPALPSLGWLCQQSPSPPPLPRRLSLLHCWMSGPPGSTPPPRQIPRPCAPPPPQPAFCI